MVHLVYKLYAHVPETTYIIIYFIVYKHISYTNMNN